MVVADLTELLNVDTSNQAVSGWDEQSNDYVTRLDLKDNTYINSGVLVLNLEKWRTHSYGQNCLRWLRENPEKVFLHDQDAINVVLDGHKLKIDPKWNLNPVFAGQLKVLESYPSRILHFGGPIKPWHKCYDFQLQAIYKKYLSFTDWSESFELIEPINTAQSISVANQYFETQDVNNAAKYYVTALDFWVKTKGAGSKLIIELINGGHRHYNSQDFFSACEYYRLVIEQLGFPTKYDVCIYRIPGLLDTMFNK